MSLLNKLTPILIALFSHSSVACVVETVLLTDLRNNDIAASSVITLRIHETIKECNQSSRAATRILSSDKFHDMWDNSRLQSLTFTCKLADQCRPDDKDKVKLFSFVYLRTDYERNMSFDDVWKSIHEN